MGGGNPLKKVVREVERVGSQVAGEAERIGEQATKAGTSVLAAAADPGVWVSYATNPTFGGAMGVEKATETYQAMTQAERDAADAKAREAMAREEERKALAEQERMISDKARAAATQAKERATRLGKGRRGLLYQGQETGVTNGSKVLGG